VPRLIEFILLFVAAPGVIALVSAQHRWVVLASIVSSTLLSIALLWSDASYPRSQLDDFAGMWRGFVPMLVRAAAVLLAFLLVLRATGRWPSFRLPRERPAVWLGVLFLYPFVSAVPQELMYRALLFHRYRGLFPTPAAMIAASALSFGWAHVVVHNKLAVLLATGAGLLLSVTWQVSRSIPLVGFEHWLYGAFILSAGIGGMFVNGTRLVSSLLR